jgi:hypothetical protein
VTRTPLHSLRSAAFAVAATGGLALSVPAVLAAHQTAFAGHGALSPAMPTTSDCQGHRLHTDAVRPGQCVLVAAPGFAPREAVRVRRLTSANTTIQVAADDQGIATFKLTIARSAKPGPDVLTFNGLGQTNASRVGSANVTVTVPRHAVYRFIISRGGVGEDNGGSKTHDDW